MSRNTCYQHQLALLLIDIDHFKDINDTFGHDIGDEVLKGHVVMVQNKLRTSDMFGRWGGEEFIVMLPETDPGQATIVANRLLNYLAETPVHTDCGKQISLTVSIGMTVAGNFATLRPDIIKTADKALYLAKNRGRNNIVLL
nr:GGDEF domain-containing protein [Pelobacter seleniigenes]